MFPIKLYFIICSILFLNFWNFATESKTCNFLFPGYSLITNYGACNHVDGGHPSYCIHTSISTISSCESYCTNQKSCVGYAHSAKYEYCLLYVTDSTCPSGFNFDQTEKTAKTMNDLVAQSYPRYVCYGRHPGEHIITFWQWIWVF